MLVVEDEAAVRLLLDVVLQDAGFAVRVEATGEAALEALKEERFNVVFLDKNLPGISGIDVLRTLRESDQVAGCVMATGYASEQSARDAMNLGIDGYLTKPFDDISDVVAAVLAAEVACYGRRRAAPRRTSSDVIIACADPELCDRLRQGVPKAAKARFADCVATLLERARASPDAVCVVDADLAEGDAVKVIRRLREVAPDAVCFVLAGSEPLSALLTMMDLGVRGVIDKPVDTLDLRGRIERSMHLAGRG